MLQVGHKMKLCEKTKINASAHWFGGESEILSYDQHKTKHFIGILEVN